MVKCSAVNCSSATYNISPGITFHRFPKNEDTKKAWVQNMKRKDWQPNANSVLCSKHFEDHLLDSSVFCTRLRPGAIPTLFIEFPESQKITVTSKDYTPIQTNAVSDEGGDDESLYEDDESPINTAGGDATVPAGSSRRHEGYRCDVCCGDIVGFRYACVQCADFDLCGACEARGEHAAHYVLRVPHTILTSDTRALIRKIREQLSNEDFEIGVKTELKEESESQEDQDPDPLVNTCDDQLRPDISFQVSQSKEDEALSSVTSSGLVDEVNQQVLAIQPQPPVGQSSQSQVVKASSDKPKTHQDPPVTHKRKRRLMITFEDFEWNTELDEGVVIKEEVGEEMEAEGGSYGVSTHCAEDSADASTSTTEPLPSIKESTPSRTKRKKK